MKWEEANDRLDKIISKNIHIYKKRQITPVPLIAEKKDLSGPIFKVEIPVLDKAGKISTREIYRKYKVPAFNNLKRLTPIPCQVAPIVTSFIAPKEDNRTETEYMEESIAKLENEEHKSCFIFDIDSFIDAEFLSKSKNVIFYNDLPFENCLNGLNGVVEQIFNDDATVLIKSGSTKIIKRISLVKLTSEDDKIYLSRLQIAEKLRNEFEYNSVLHQLVRRMMKDSDCKTFKCYIRENDQNIK